MLKALKEKNEKNTQHMIGYMCKIQFQIDMKT